MIHLGTVGSETPLCHSTKMMENRKIPLCLTLFHVGGKGCLPSKELHFDMKRIGIFLYIIFLQLREFKNHPRQTLFSTCQSSQVKATPFSTFIGKQCRQMPHKSARLSGQQLLARIDPPLSKRKHNFMSSGFKCFTLPICHPVTGIKFLGTSSSPLQTSHLGRFNQKLMKTHIVFGWIPGDFPSISWLV